MNSHVLYLALGTYRVQAAREQVREFVSSGSRVSLVAPDAPEWQEAFEELGRLDGVEVVRVAPDKDGIAWTSAKKLAGAKSGPFTQADTLVAGDAQALPVAWSALRRRPELTFRMERYDTAGRRPEPSDLAVVTPWYPSPNNPFAGGFVEASTRAVADRFGKVALYHTEDWSGAGGNEVRDAIAVTAERFQEQRPELVPVLDTPEGTLTRVPVPLLRRKNYAPWVSTQEAALRRALPTGRIEAPIVHAHTGIYGGVLAMRLARPDARIVVTEHASFLAKVWSQPAARALYGDVLKRADTFLCVSRSLREEIAEQFPHHAHKLRVVPNVIDFDRFTPGPQRSPEMLRWLYVGRLIELKGVNQLLEAFALVAKDEPKATLTMVGSGKEEEALRERATELGVADRFEVLPPVAPDAVGELMHRYDLLVHASRMETFGMTVVEAVATGLPVLVSRSAGPEETLEGIESLAGSLMEAGKDPRIIAVAYWRLRERAGELGLPEARRILQSRYGPEAVARQLWDVYQGVDLPDPEKSAARAEESVRSRKKAPAGAKADGDAPSTGPVGRAVVLALTPGKPRRIVDFANDLVARGAEVTLVTAKSDVWKKLDRGINVLSIEAAEKKLRIPRGERFLVYRAPQAVLRRARKLAARNRQAIAPELAVASVQRVHSRAANAFHKRVFNSTYRQVRPRLLSRLAKREVLPQLTLETADHVFVSDVNSIVTGWKWAKRHRHLKVTTSLDPEVYGPKAE
ncbi:glycosyltransferase family 4 protein [Streptomyces sp. NPDC055722]